MIWVLVALLASAGGADPRIEIVNAQLAEDPRAALTLADQLLAADPDRARSMGFEYLRGDLLERLGRQREADAAFAAAMSGVPQLAPHGRYRLALSQSRRGHPEVAAGLLASLLAANPPEPLVAPAARLFADALSRGGDCRLLRAMTSWSLGGESRRLIELSAIDCALKSAAAEESMGRLLRLLEETFVDEPARLAAERLHRHFESRLTKRRDLLLVGRVFHHQRQFDFALRYLARGLATPSSPEDDPAQEAEARYALARSHFWRAEYLDAVREFGRVAELAGRTEEAAGALYQQARSYELYGSREAAANSYRQSYLEDPDSRWAAPALLSTLRIDWRRGREQEALAIFDVLGSRRSWSRLHGRAALFLASSDIVQGRADRAEDWLLQTRRASRNLAHAASFWTGRLEELQGNFERAADAYLDVAAEALFHPLAQLARGRLASDGLSQAARALAANLSTASDTDSLYRAWIVLGDEPAGVAAFSSAASRLRRSHSTAPFFTLEFISPASWPIWETPIRAPEEVLAALGLWREGQAATLRHFPASSVSLAYTGSRLLTRGGAHRAALRQAEILHEAARVRLPAPFIPVPLRRAVFPLPYGPEIARAAASHNVDPYLLTALIREESRFDTAAVSLASARGLTQFILPTARRLASRAGLEGVDAEDLHQPAIATALGAAYLDELLERFDGREYQAVAAYNAGERQAELWMSYCFTEDPAEYFTKVGFPETRAYLEKVLSSRAQYSDLYPLATFDPS